MLICLSNSPDVDSMSMCQSNSHCDADATIVDAGNIRFVTLSTTSVSDGIKLSDPHENHMLHRILLDSYTFAVETLDGWKLHGEVVRVVDCGGRPAHCGARPV
jgi:hypothetical protein